MTLPFISIICPVYNEKEYIEKCICSILQQDYPKENIEILFVDGMSTDETREIITKYSKEYSFLKLLDNPQKIVPCAMNIGIQSAVGEVVIRLDGHCVYPPNYISSLVEYLYKLNADNVGGVWNILPANQTAEAQAVAIASSHSFGVGNVAFRIGTTQIKEVDTVPFGCYKRKVFDKIGLFDEELIRNQDNEFNARLKNAGGKIYLIPDITIDYYARSNIKKICSMYYQYSLFTPLVQQKLGKCDTWRRMIPTLFLIGLLLGGISCFIPAVPNVIKIAYLIIVASYGINSLFIGLQQSIKYKHWGLLYYLPVTFFCIHLTYGWAYIVGVYKIVTHSKFHATINR